MERTFTGLISSTNLGVLGDKRYGFLSIETDEHQHIKFKVTAFTKYESLDIGARVTIEGESVDGEDTWNAKTVQLAK